MLKIKMQNNELKFKTFNIPTLSHFHLEKKIKTLLQSRKSYLSHLPTEKIIDTLDQVATRWLNSKDPIRRKAERLLTQTTRCSREIIREGLNLAFREVQAPKLQSSFQMLEKFLEPRLSCFIFAGMIPTPMLFDVFLSFLLRSAIIAKSPSKEPIFLSLLAQSIQEVDPNLGKCFTGLWWPGGRDDLEKEVFRKADLIHAYGDNETLEKIKVKIPPNKIFLEFGHKVSFCFIGKEPLKNQPKLLACQAALDVALYDQQGCLSPHVIYLEGNARESIEWAKSLAQALQKISQKLPPGTLSLGEASQIHQFRARYTVLKEASCFFDPQHIHWTVIYDSTRLEFPTPCLNRVIFVKSLQSIEDLPKIIKKEKASVQAIGHAVTLKHMEKLHKIQEQFDIPFLPPLGSMQALTFQDHLKERLKLLQNAKTS